MTTLVYVLSESATGLRATAHDTTPNLISDLPGGQHGLRPAMAGCATQSRAGSISPQSPKVRSPSARIERKRIALRNSDGLATRPSTGGSGDAITLRKVDRPAGLVRTRALVKVAAQTGILAPEGRGRRLALAERFCRFSPYPAIMLCSCASCRTIFCQIALRKSDQPGMLVLMRSVALVGPGMLGRGHDPALQPPAVWTIALRRAAVPAAKPNSGPHGFASSAPRSSRAGARSQT